MKKLFIIIISVISFFLIILYSILSVNYKVFRLESPSEIYIDLNKNLIFDEKAPVIVEDIYFLDDKNNISSKFDFINSLSQKEKTFISYKAFEYSKWLLSNKFVKYKDNEIYVGNQKYKDLMLKSHLVFDNSIDSQNKFIDNIKSINVDDYVLYNSRSKKFHKLDCHLVANYDKYNIVKYSDVEGTPCKACFIQNNSNELKNPEKDKKNFSDTFYSKNLNLFFHDLNIILKPTSLCSSDSCKALKKEIDNAKYSIDFAVYGIENQPEIINALSSALNRGVKIRWVTDFDKNNDNYYKDTDKLKNIIQNYMTDKEYENNKTSAIMHNKFFIFDNKKVWTGSANITGTDLTGFNANYSVLINSEELAKIYLQEFEQMYNGTFHTDKKFITTDYIFVDKDLYIKPLFSPQNSIIDNEIIPLIKNAEKYVYIPIFYITHKGIEQALIEAHNRGVNIKIINDATNAHSKYTIHHSLRKAGIKVKTENYAGKMHMKAMIVDDIVSVIGSMNFTKSANNKNDENVLIIKSNSITKYMKNTFLYLWDKIPQKYEIYDPNAESIESIGSCFDGIDNDFDSLIDSEDNGCKFK